MAPSFDCGISSLLCVEDNDGIFYDNGCYGTVLEDFEASWNHRNHRKYSQNKGFDSGDGVPLQSEECLALMFKKECQHLPNGDYLKRLRSGDLDMGARQEVVDWIGKVGAHFGFGPLCGYLSINYLDRFLSAYELPKGKAWMMHLLAVACLSLAAKLEEPEVPLSLDLQIGESKFVFEAKTIQRMELLILSTLKWRMQAVTPFSFLDCFLHKINDDQMTFRHLIMRSTQVILSTIKGTDFLEYKPSEVAAAVAISIAGEAQTVDPEQAFSALAKHVDKDRALKCIKLIKDLSLVSGSVEGGSASVLSVPQSPIGVLDAACLSYKSDDTIVGSCANSSHNTPVNKKRKLNTACEVEL
ncbi:Cyclin_N domain-containing protein/Cyclin_C domain-containing protein [Cephalotus follicularis]|uniref:B-like cyclin n=1 Tax=Cephalotus follicularis TaxID=3775 RepID=A0A1Q3BG33_CEPFO|nr:Cyclin_N domain-containing protein/Cyclin_C domain-containing protein [Cephalotus follicularis]